MVLRIDQSFETFTSFLSPPVTHCCANSTCIIYFCVHQEQHKNHLINTGNLRADQTFLLPSSSWSLTEINSFMFCSKDHNWTINYIKVCQKDKRLVNFCNTWSNFPAGVTLLSDVRQHLFIIIIDVRLLLTSTNETLVAGSCSAEDALNDRCITPRHSTHRVDRDRFNLRVGKSFIKSVFGCFTAQMTSPRQEDWSASAEEVLTAF